jgi:uncharacterized membrane protein
MEDTNLPNQDTQLPPVVSSPPRRSGWRIAAGAIVCILTLVLTLVLSFLSICFGLLMQNSSSSYGMDAPWIFALFVVTILVPIGGVWLAVRLLRAPKSLYPPGAMAGVPVAVSPVAPRASTKEIEERLAYLRLAILIVVLAHAALLVLNLSRHTASYGDWKLIVIVNFVLYQVPYGIALLGIRERAERWALALTFMFPILAACFSVFIFATTFWRLRNLPSYPFTSYTGFFALGIALDAAVAVFAWQAWRTSGPSSDDAAQLTIWGVASAVYLSLLQWLTPLFYSWRHF